MFMGDAGDLQLGESPTVGDEKCGIALTICAGGANIISGDEAAY
jgi:hypothetical protein